jgi:hypothetical protein
VKKSGIIIKLIKKILKICIDYIEPHPLAFPLRQAFQTPWKFRNEISRLTLLPYIRLLFAMHSIKWGKGWRIHGAPILQKHRKSTMRFGDGLDLRSSPRSNPLGPNRPIILCTWTANAVLEAGDCLGMTGGTLCAAQRITIGNHVTIGANSTLVDTDFHPLDPTIRKERPQEGKTAPIIIEDDVFVGMNALILKGVRLGRGCIVGAGSVVSHDVAPFSIVAGNPAREIRKIPVR